MGDNGYNIARLAAASGLSRGTISNWINTGAKPDVESLVAVAKVLKVSPAEIFQMAGIQPAHKGDVHIERTVFYMSSLGEEDKAEIEQIAELKFSKAKERKSLDQLISLVEALPDGETEATLNYLVTFFTSRGFKIRRE